MRASKKTFSPACYNFIVLIILTEANDMSRSSDKVSDPTFEQVKEVSCFILNNVFKSSPSTDKSDINLIDRTSLISNLTHNPLMESKTISAGIDKIKKHWIISPFIPQEFYEELISQFAEAGLVVVPFDVPPKPSDKCWQVMIVKDAINVEKFKAFVTRNKIEFERKGPGIGFSSRI